MNDDPFCQLVKFKEQYRRLTEEHQRLQLEYSNRETQFRKELESLNASQIECANLLETLKTKNKELENELICLRPNILTNETVQLIKVKATEEVEKNFVEERRQYLSQIEQITRENCALNRENDFLKGELSNICQNFERQEEDFRKRMETETSTLQKQRETLLLEERTRISEASKQAKQLELENRQLSMQLNGMMKENEELTLANQKTFAEHNNNIRECSKKIATLNGQLAQITVERDCCRQQSDQLSRELASLSEANVRLTSRVHDLERQSGHLQAMIDELNHTHSMELNNLKLQCVNEKSTIEKERTDMRLQLKECLAERDNLNTTLSQKIEEAIDKERVCQQKVSQAQDDALKIKTQLEDQM